MTKFAGCLEKKNHFEKYKDIESTLVYGKNNISNEKITIFIPTYNRTDLLEIALKSAISQKTAYSYKIIVVDNYAEINTKTDQLMSRYCNEYQNICYYRNRENIGMFGNWNRGIELVRTEYLAILHDDDVLCDNYIENVMNCFINSSVGIVGVFSKFMEDINSNLIESERCISQNKFKRYISKMAAGQPLKLDISDNYRSITITPTACAFRRSAMIESGGFDEEFFPISDIVFFNKITYLYGGMIIPQFLAIRRIGDNEMKNVVVQCTVLSKQYHYELCNILYSGRKKWIADYDAAVNHLIFLSKKYDPSLDVYKILKENELPVFWKNVPSIFCKMILASFWIRLLIRNR